MKQKSLKILATLVLIAAGSHNTALADNPSQGAYDAPSTIAKQTCDSAVWETMNARAHIETEREIMQNQNLIFKPDSILHYVCFDKFAGHAAKNVGVLFSETTFFGGSKIEKGSETPKAVDDVVIDGAMKPYVEANFNHNLLGGRGDDLKLSKPSVTPSATSYSCNVMANVWKTAKCVNFIAASNWRVTDGYYPFVGLTPTNGGESIAGYDTIKEVRKYPSNMACSGEPFEGIGSNWQDQYNLSRNYNGGYNRKYEYETPNKKIFDNVRKKVEPGSCSGSAIKTGLKVILNSGQTYDDGVCTNPGCRLTNGGQCS